MNSPAAPSLPTQLLWASGSIASGAVFNAIAIFALYYMNSVLGINAALAGTLLLVTKLYDAITDPIVGTLSDRTQHAWGPRRPYVLVGAVLLGLSFAALFSQPIVGGWQQIALVVVTLLVFSTAYTIFTVPYLAMPPAIAPTYDSRAQLMTFRVAFLILGVLIGSVGGPKIVAMAEGGAAGYQLLGICIGLVATFFGLLAFFGTANVKETVTRAESDKSLIASSLGGLSDVYRVFGNMPFRILTLVKLLQLAVLAVLLACTPFFFSLVLGRSPEDIASYLMTFSLCGLVSLGIWRFIIPRFGKRNTYIVSIAGYGLGMASWYWWHPGEAESLFYVRAAVTGVLSNGTLLCALSLLPDTMEYDKIQSGENRSGVMSGVFTTVEKLSTALGPFIVGIALEVSGLVTGAAPEAQPASAIEAVHITFSLIPALLCFAAIPVLWLYRLDERELANVRAARGEA